jgi:hypothetical protein
MSLRSLRATCSTNPFDTPHGSHGVDGEHLRPASPSADAGLAVTAALLSKQIVEFSTP